ncbi:YetF domain-containing protein, partial [Caldisalinibacter kiritimatiensis]
FITRILGRQQVAQLTFFEYINGITFGSIAATLATDVNQRTYQHFIGLMLFGILTGLVSYFSVKKRKFRKIVEGEPILVIQNGKILENNLRKVRYSTDELNLLLRDKGVFSPEDVEYGLLEINGKLSIMKKTDKKTVTCGDLGILKNADTLSTEVIIGGQIIYENLRERKLSGKDLMRMLKPFGIRRISEVHYATLDENNKIYIDKYDDKINPKIDISENNDNV